MLAIRVFLPLMLLLSMRGQAQDVQVKRVWLADQEAGEATERQTADARGVRMESVETTRLERMGATIQFEVR